jgi:hypothetical protein
MHALSPLAKRFRRPLALSIIGLFQRNGQTSTIPTRIGFEGFIGGWV